LYQIRVDVLKQDPHMHSFYTIEGHGTPAYTLFHRQETPVKFYRPKLNCQFAATVFEQPLPIAYDKDFTKCI